ncbi:MAG: hypothetical protein BWY51_00403 [Parcubacteria group bacterium ADurb.Bin316]|nr:MAG: hypothetical protein BWY51_00403 [Parcubacteria group bacterium ADurb.Bin316]HOZ56374.1 DUF167 domain-containing protein [bacterium]
MKRTKRDNSQQDEIYLRIKVRPSAAKNSFREKLADGTWKIDIAATPERGKANQELIKFLAQEFKVKKDNIKIISGAGEHIKLIKVIK